MLFDQRMWRGCAAVWKKNPPGRYRISNGIS